MRKGRNDSCLHRTAAPAPYANLGLTQPARWKASAPAENLLDFATRSFHTLWTPSLGDGHHPWGNPSGGGQRNFRM